MKSKAILKTDNVENNQKKPWKSPEIMEEDFSKTKEDPIFLPMIPAQSGGS